VNCINRNDADNYDDDDDNNNVVRFGSKLHWPDWVSRHNSGRTEKYIKNP